jgi:RimJ/RimL family protein N-acetyltransferase
MILLETERLRLRRFTAGDLDRLVELDSDPEVMRYITGGAPTPRELYETLILPRWFAIYSARPAEGYWAAEDRGTDAFLGWFHLREDRIEPAYLELGYRLRRDCWGRGLATEGSHAVIRHGFERAAAERISSRTLKGNLASQRVMQKCGLRCVGEFSYADDAPGALPGMPRAAVKYEITRPEWLARQG